MSNDPYSQARYSAINLLSRREHSSKELKQKLSDRGFNEQIIDSVLEKLKKDNLLSDERFSENFVYRRISRGYGPVKIEQELRQHNITDDVIDQAFAANEVDWEVLACQVRKKRFGHESPQTLNEKAKQMRFLQSRGFSSNQIRTALDTSDLTD